MLWGASCCWCLAILQYCTAWEGADCGLGSQTSPLADGVSIIYVAVSPQVAEPPKYGVQEVWMVTAGGRPCRDMPSVRFPKVWRASHSLCKCVPSGYDVSEFVEYGFGGLLGKTLAVSGGVLSRGGGRQGVGCQKATSISNPDIGCMLS